MIMRKEKLGARYQINLALNADEYPDYETLRKMGFNPKRIFIAGMNILLNKGEDNEQ